MIVAGDIGSLIDFFSFTVWIFYGMAMLALIMMRRTKPDAPRPYKVRVQTMLAVFTPVNTGGVYVCGRGSAAV